MKNLDMRAVELFILTVFLVSVCGCSVVTHIDEIFALKQVAKAQEDISKHIKQQDENFQALLDTVRSEGLGKYKDAEAVLKAFGPPVFSRERMRHGVVFDVWLYRHSTGYFSSEKVYMYFDKNGRLAEWEYVP